MGFESFVERSFLVVDVGLVEINVIGLQTFEGFVSRNKDVRLVEAFLSGRHLHSALCGYYYVFAISGARKPLANDRFGFTALVAGNPSGICIGGINQIEAGGNECVE